MGCSTTPHSGVGSKNGRRRGVHGALGVLAMAHYKSPLHADVSVKISYVHPRFYIILIIDYKDFAAYISIIIANADIVSFTQVKLSQFIFLDFGLNYFHFYDICL